MEAHAHPSQSIEGTCMRSIQFNNPNSADRRPLSIDTSSQPSIGFLSQYLTKKCIKYGYLMPDEFGISRDADGHARAMDERILYISKDDIADILQVANGLENLFLQQRSNPDNIPEDPDEHPTANAANTGFHQSYRPAHLVSTDRRLESGLRAYDQYGARKFRWEQKDEYGVYRDEFGYARGVADEIIPVTKADIRNFLERASMSVQSYICFPEHAASFIETRLPPEIYTKDEINEIVTGICGAQEKLGEELQTLEVVDDEDEKLKSLSKEWGENVTRAVKTAIEELNEFNPSGRYAVPVLWNFEHGKKATLKEGIAHMMQQIKNLKPKRT
ncbi:hypothetical protein Bca101_081704 [Brassica carinata]